MQQKTTLSKEDTSTHVPSKVSPKASSRHRIAVARKSYFSTLPTD